MYGELEQTCNYLWYLAGNTWGHLAAIYTCLQCTAWFLASGGVVRAARWAN
jgi:hypothetical protein